MLSDSGPSRIYLACGVTDMRKSIDSLASLVTHRFGGDPFSDAWFVFCNHNRDKLKLLRWDRNGFWLYYRRLEKGRFDWPSSSGSQGQPTCSVSRQQLTWLLDGLPLHQPLAHREVTARFVV
jgi:transposase